MEKERERETESKVKENMEGRNGSSGTWKEDGVGEEKARRMIRGAKCLNHGAQ